ncbi:MAG: hypothetical protein A2289_25470 [Deltaproteobacteria bacterium RIFOXYA12_FULL_58_15]|nr:MAG: hypothetical protein A2289_25470 [Deltaproteobacteria bacterium RIFOXYA12_FULL_58_15]OGR09044.1 MAG: hypothetical protein A2341_25955 [Deltaproteobacteria bacterium RIFOXYB12_FULL_58_9]
MGFDRHILFTGLIGLASACTPTAEEACVGFCRSEVECSMIGNDAASGCLTRCEAQLSNSTPQCDVAFRRYAACYDDSPSCNAADCFDSFTSFADSCAWYAAEMSLSAGPQTAKVGAENQVSPTGG